MFDFGGMLGRKMNRNSGICTHRHSYNGLSFVPNLSMPLVFFWGGGGGAGRMPVVGLLEVNVLLELLMYSVGPNIV